MRKSILCCIILFLFYFVSIIFSQDISNKYKKTGEEFKSWTFYEKKTITILPFVWFKSSNDFKFIQRKVVWQQYNNRRVKRYVENNFKDKILIKSSLLLKDKLSLKRFFLNNLSFEQLRKYQREVERFNLNKQQLSIYIKDKLLEDFIKMQQDSSYKRAVANIDETQIDIREAQYKDYGVTEEQILKVLNSGYIFAPYIEFFDVSRSPSYDKVKEVKQGNKIKKKRLYAYKYIIKLGILLYKVNINYLDSVNYIKNLELLGDVSYQNSEIVFFNKETTFEKLMSEADEFVVSSVALLSDEVETKLKKMKEFRLTGMYKEKATILTKVDIGSREGIHTDDKFYIIEAMETDTGIKENIIGWTTIKKVGGNETNRDALSTAYVISGIPDVGYKALEIVPYPNFATIGINLLEFSFLKDNIHVDHIEIDSNFKDLRFYSNYIFHFDFAHNLGRHLGVNKLFLGFGLFWGIGKVEGKYFFNYALNRYDQPVFDMSYPYRDSTNFSSSITDGFYFYFQKKFILKRFLLSFKPIIGFSSFHLDCGEIETLKADTLYLGLYDFKFLSALETKIEYALTPFTNIGFGVRVDFSNKFNSLDFSVTNSGLLSTFPTLGIFFSDNESESRYFKSYYKEPIHLSKNRFKLFFTITKDYW